MSAKVETMLAQMMEEQARQAKAIARLDQKLDGFYTTILQDAKHIASLVALCDRYVQQIHGWVGEKVNDVQEAAGA